MESGVSRTLSYLQCVHLIQDHLEKMPHGTLIHWCAEHSLTYNTVLGLKSNRMNFFAPHLVADVMRALNYEVWVTKNKLKEKKEEAKKEKVENEKKEKKKDKQEKMKETLYIVKKNADPTQATQDTSLPDPAE